MQRPQHDVSAVITAMNLNGLGVVRSLGRRGVRVVAMHRGEENPELKTRYIDELWRLSEAGDEGEAVVAELLRRGPEFGDERPVLMTITDSAVRAVARYHEQLSQYYRIPFGDPQAVRRLLCKAGIDEAAAEHSVSVPQTFVIDEASQMAEVSEALRYPAILKPQIKTPEYTAAGGPKAHRVESADELREIYARFSAVEPRVIVQQFIPGGDDQVYFCQMALAQDGSVLGSFVGHKIRQWPPHCGGTASCEPADAPELDGMSADFLAGSGLRGVCGVEYKRDPRDGRFYLIEPTVGRPDWQHAVTEANGLPLPYLVYCDCLGAPLPALRSRRARRRWVELQSDLRSAEYYRQRGELSRAAWLWSVRPPMQSAYLALDDLGPSLHILRAKAGRAWRRLRRILGGQRSDG